MSDSRRRRTAIVEALQEWAVDGVLPRYAQTEVAKQFGVTHQRVQQIAASAGLLGSKEIYATKVFLACGTCGVRPVQGWRTGGVQCVECKKVPVVCDYCGVVTYHDEAQFLNSARRGRGLGGSWSGRVQCGRAGRKRCPRGPVMFALQLGPEWEKAWIPGSAYVQAAATAAFPHGFKVSRQWREDGYWMRRVA